MNPSPEAHNRKFFVDQESGYQHHEQASDRVQGTSLHNPQTFQFNLKESKGHKTAPMSFGTSPAEVPVKGKETRHNVDRKSTENPVEVGQSNVRLESMEDLDDQVYEMHALFMYNILNVVAVKGRYSRGR